MRWVRGPSEWLPVPQQFEYAALYEDPEDFDEGEQDKDIKDDDKKEDAGSDIVKPETPIKVEGVHIVVDDMPNDPNPHLTGGGDSEDPPRAQGTSGFAF